MVSFENRMEMFNIFTSNEIKKKPVCERYEFVIDLTNMLDISSLLQVHVLVFKFLFK